MANISSGRHVFIQELVDNPKQYDNTSIRVVGNLIDYHASRNTATMVYKNASLRVNTELIDVYVRDACMVQCIGEVTYDQAAGQLVFKPRTLRNIDIINMEIYENTIKLYRQHEENATSS